MKRILKLASIVLLINSNVSCTDKHIIPPVTTGSAPVDKGWLFESTPAWADEFDYNGKPDASKWGYDLGGSGWGNNELENYTDDVRNASVGGGNLIITAIKETSGNRQYSSARVVSKDGGDFLYGRIEASLKVPAGKGTWPAFWMLPTGYFYGDWPNSGEVDIMEHVGYDPNNMHISFHTKDYNFKLGNQKTIAKTIPTAIAEFHKYRVDWTPYSIKGYIDDVLLIEYVNAGNGYGTWPFDKNFHLLFNLAIGGDWGGAQGVDNSIFPVSYYIDYVRYYKMIEK